MRKCKQGTQPNQVFTLPPLRTLKIKCTNHNLASLVSGVTLDLQGYGSKLLVRSLQILIQTSLGVTRTFLEFAYMTNLYVFFLLVLFVCLFPFSGLHLQHIGISRLGVESELPLPACAAATATRDLSHICDLHPSLRQRWILHPLSKARDQTCILMGNSWVLDLPSHSRHSLYMFSLQLLLSCSSVNVLTSSQLLQVGDQHVFQSGLTQLLLIITRMTSAAFLLQFEFCGYIVCKFVWFASCLLRLRVQG